MDVKKIIEHCLLHGGSCEGCIFIEGQDECYFRLIPEDWDLEYIDIHLKKRPK